MKKKPVGPPVRPPEYYEASTVIGGKVRVVLDTRTGTIVPDYVVVRLDHEDGYLEFTEEEALNLMDALVRRLNQARRKARDLAYDDGYEAGREQGHADAEWDAEH